MSIAHKIYTPLPRATFFIAIFIIFIDQLSKYFVRELICLHESILLIEDIFYLTHIQNPGAAFGLFRYQTVFLISASLLSIVILILMVHRHKEHFFQATLGFIVGGATGNLIDRVSFGYVIDFLNLGFREYRWPVFNIADIAITVGVVIIIWKLLKRPYPEGKGNQELKCKI